MNVVGGGGCFEGKMEDRAEFYDHGASADTINHHVFFHRHVIETFLDQFTGAE